VQKNKSWGLIVGLIVISSGCAHLASTGTSSYFEAGGTVAECAHFFTGLDRLVDEAGVRDVQAAQVAYYPYL
jgi:hypothetical protein